MYTVTIVYEDGSPRVAHFNAVKDEYGHDNYRAALECFNLACEDSQVAFALFLDRDGDQINRYCKGATF